MISEHLKNNSYSTEFNIFDNKLLSENENDFNNSFEFVVNKGNVCLLKVN